MKDQNLGFFDEEEMKDITQYAHGYMCCDGLNDIFPKKGVCDVMPLVWFLNVASVYRDMRMEERLEMFDYLCHNA